MNGKGTQESPYIIMNADDLYSMGTVGGNDVYFSLGADIDFNDTQYAEKFVPIPLNCKKFTGNSHVIRNVNYSSPNENVSMFTVADDGEDGTLTIEGLKTENIRLVGKNVFIFGNGGGKCSISLEHCVLVMNDMIAVTSTQGSANSRHCIMHDNDITVSADYCTFVIKAQFVKMYAVLSGDTVLHTQMRIEINTNTFADTGNAYNAVLSGTTVSDSYFFLKVDSNGTSNSGKVDFSSYSSTFSRSYMVFEAVRGIAIVYWYGDVRNTCFYDKNVLMKHNEYTAMRYNDSYSINVHALTTEQCKNPAYLRSIGFNCMGADE